MNQVEALDRYTLTGSTHSYEHVERVAPSYIKNVLNPLTQELFRTHRFQGRFLDLACGRGLVADHVEDFTEMEVVRADISEIGLQAGSNSRVRSLATQLPFADSSFLAVHMKDALIHIDDHDLLFQEIHRILVPGGQALLVSEAHFSPSFTYRLKGKKEKTHVIESMKEYLNIVNMMSQNPDIKEFGPPYFKVDPERVIGTGIKNGLILDKKYHWQPDTHEIEWHTEPVQRFVLNFSKPYKV